MRREDIAGQVFGRYTAVSYAGNRRWLCRCACGTEEIIWTSDLKSGKTKSCGCYRREHLSELRTIDLVGKVFGKLTVVDHAGSTNYRKSRWLCRCSCGNMTTVASPNLTNEGTISCGCARRDGIVYRTVEARAITAVYDARRRSRKAMTGGSFTPLQIERLKVLQRGKCACCHVKLGSNFHRDHITPLALGGSNDIHNIQLLCSPCNLSKGAKDPLDWAKLHGRLI